MIAAHRLIMIEAHEVQKETGLTPRQLAEQRAALLAALKEADAVEELDFVMRCLERRRCKGVVGITTDDDKDAKEWQEAAKKAGALLLKRRHAIAKAEVAQ